MTLGLWLAGAVCRAYIVLVTSYLPTYPAEGRFWRGV
jgi:hypothetical protein